MKKQINKVLVTGAFGQIGSELTPKLREKYGNKNVITADLRNDIRIDTDVYGENYALDVRDKNAMEEVVQKHEIDTIVHMAAILSGIGEQYPEKCWDVNMNGTINVINLTFIYHITPRVQTPGFVY